jgi:transcriptional regulator of acetoin/glycerol metabolism
MSVATAWERFQSGEEPPDVRGDVLTSWRRSRFSGVDPETVDVPQVETDVDSHFLRVAEPIMTGMAELLTGDSSCLALADERGGVLWRWVSEPMLRGVLDDLSVVEGACFDEEFVGTNGLGTALETGGIAVIRGSEHFVQRFHDVTCVAAPVRHPVTRRTVGAVNVTCRAEHTSPLLKVVVRKLVDEIRAGLLACASDREQQLLQAFLAAQRATQGPVLTVGEGVVIANDAAADLGIDGRRLWDEIRATRSDRPVLEVPADLGARLRVLRSGSTPTGAVLTVSGPVAEAPRRRTTVPSTPRGVWDRLLDDVRRLAAAGPVLVRGETGTGKATLLAEALCGEGTGGDGTGADGPAGAATIDAATCAVEGLPTWAARLTALLDGTAPVVLRHVELLAPDAVRAVAALVEARPGHPALGLTHTPPDDRGSDLADRLAAGTVTVPPLRRRADDVPGIAQRELRRHGERLTFALDAQAALRRHDWPGNGRELARVVRDAARRAHGGVVGIDALPAEVRAAAGRRVLTPLERAESSVIASVLEECAGNKSAAAKELGISRTALYAKIRSYRL